MSLIRSKSTRVIFSDNGTLSDLTEQCRSWDGPAATIPAWIAAEDALYIGQPHKFNSRYVSILTGNTGVTGSAPIDEVQELSFSALPTSGNFQLRFNSIDTGLIAFDSDATDIQAALNAIIPITGMEVAGDFSVGFELHFTGSDGGKPQNLITVINNTLVDVSLAPITPLIVQTQAGAYAVEPSLSGPLGFEYWSQAGWVTFDDILDETNGLNKSGWIQWEEKPEWAKQPPSSITGLSTLPKKEELYWIRLTLSVDASPIAIQAIKFLLSDDRKVTQIYPEIMNYLPKGQTTLLPQHELAKDAIVAHLIKSGLIAYEEQIKVPDEWLICASYKAIEILLTPIARDEEMRKIVEAMATGYEMTRPDHAASLDIDRSEDLDSFEKEPGFLGSIPVYRR